MIGIVVITKIEAAGDFVDDADNIVADEILG